MIVAGVDIGSTTAKAVLINEGKISGTAVTPTGADCNAAAEKALAMALKPTGMRRDAIQYVVSTGYGRRAINFGNESVTEITANARGAVSIGSKSIRTIIDVGGQDTKTIILDEQGRITNFVMNDKCAAGTGRFLEVIARVLQEPMENFVGLSLASKSPVTINSTCTVFAESEVVSLIANKVEKQDIICGIHKGISKRIGDMARAAGAKPSVFFDGGGALNLALKKEIERELGMQLTIPKQPQVVVAMGAAIIAYEKYLKIKK